MYIYNYIYNYIYIIYICIYIYIYMTYNLHRKFTITRFFQNMPAPAEKKKLRNKRNKQFG